MRTTHTTKASDHPRYSSFSWNSSIGHLDRLLFLSPCQLLILFPKLSDMLHLLASFTLLLLIPFAFAGQALGSMGFPMDLTSHLTGTLFHRDLPSATCVVDHGYEPSLMTPPDMVRTCSISFTNLPKSKDPAVDFKKALQDACFADNLKRFDCKPGQANVVKCEVGIGIFLDFQKLPHDLCIDEAVSESMEKDIKCDYHGF